MFARVVYRVARNWCAADPGDFDDAIQECFLKLDTALDLPHARPPAFDCEETTAAYLKVLAANAARDYFRKKNAEKRSAAKTTSVEDCLHEITDVNVSDLDRTILIRQIDRLLSGDVKGRTIFWLYYQQGFTAKEISDIPAFQLSPKGVESLLRRLTLGIREQLRDGEGFSAPEAY